jgi:hypothetical protein
VTAPSRRQVRGGHKLVAESSGFIVSFESIPGPSCPIAIVLLGFAYVVAGDDRRREGVAGG